MADTEYNLEGQFNQAGFQQVRLNDLMSVINFCWINPTKFNDNYNDFNYRVIFRSLTSYYTEIRPKLNKKEKLDTDKLLETLDAYIEKFPIIKTFTNSSFYSSNNQGTRFQSKEWNLIRKGLLTYQNLILDAADKHGLGNPSKDDSRMEVIN